MDPIDALIIYRCDCAKIQTELDVMDLTVAGTLRVDDDCQLEPYTLLEFNAEVS